MQPHSLRKERRKWIHTYMMVLQKEGWGFVTDQNLSCWKPTPWHSTWYPRKWEIEKRISSKSYPLFMFCITRAHHVLLSEKAIFFLYSKSILICSGEVRSNTMCKFSFELSTKIFAPIKFSWFNLKINVQKIFYAHNLDTILCAMALYGAIPRKNVFYTHLTQAVYSIRRVPDII